VGQRVGDPERLCCPLKPRGRAVPKGIGGGRPANQGYRRPASNEVYKAKSAVKDTVKGITAGAADVAKTGLAGRTAYGNGAPISIAVYFDGS